MNFEWHHQRLNDQGLSCDQIPGAIIVINPLVLEINMKQVLLKLQDKYIQVKQIYQLMNLLYVNLLILAMIKGTLKETS